MCGPLTHKLKASEECLKNARQFVKDAERLIESSSFGHAFSLLVLADEEMGKSLMFLFSLFGLSLKRSFLRSHARKQFVQLGMSLAWTILDLLRIENIMKAAREVKDVEKRKLLIVEEMKKIAEMDEDEMRNRLQLRIGETVDLFKDLDTRKQRGFYVELNDDGEITTPTDISEEEVLQYLGSVKSRLSKMNLVMLSEEEVRSIPEQELRKTLKRQTRERFARQIQKFEEQLTDVKSL